ncbi:M48 family metallopeptidase [Silvibacterium acidisoli]|uniref:M48 family metallopeptidase n=1 Tax=Acidobacteriaceae bacterium ZG23-2 TaxID=2883246 RepID=UPI00406C78A5
MFLPGAEHAVYTLPPDKLVKALHLSHARTLAYFGDAAWSIAFLALMVRFRAGSRISRLASRVTHRPWLQGTIVVPIWLLILTVASLPVSFLMERMDKAYGLSVEPWSLWLADIGKSLLINVPMETLAVGVLYALMRHSARRWWLWFWLISLPVLVLGVYAAPILIDPVFNHFTPLAGKDPALVTRLQEVAAKGHLEIPSSRIFVMDASRKVTGPNAYVTGFGGSKRIVVWDNTLNEMPSDEILAVYGHEQGHYVLNHIHKGLLFSAVTMFVFFWIAYRLMTWLAPRFGTPVGEWSSFGLLMLLVTILGFFAEPVGNAFSRHIEHQADVYGQEVIHGLVPDSRAAMVNSFQTLGELWLEAPTENPFVVFWTFSHPPVADRYRFAEQYDPWRPGHSPKYVQAQ